MLTGRIPQNEHNRKFMERVIEEAKQALKEPETSLPYTEYRMFGITGERVGYEAHYIKRRKRLGLFLLMCLWEEDDKAYFDALLNTIWAMLDEFSWALPAHLLTVPEERKYRRLDLFAAETALALNDVLSLIGDRLPDDVKTRIHTEVRRRILVSFFSKNEVNYPHSNWSAVQLSGILAGLSTDGTEEEFEKAVPKMLEIAGYFTGSYPEDGCCLEGALYWLFGFGYYVYAADLMSELSGGKIDLLAGEKCRKIANYWTKITLDGNNVLPYSDAPHQCNYHIGLIHYLKKRFPEIAVPGIEEEMRYGEDSRYRLPDMLRNLY
ncbi:MAG: hypothetical protein MJ082_04565 [Clostridia bacterium]|nr:hypothetical protein [Clostridia bacterium]